MGNEWKLYVSRPAWTIQDAIAGKVAQVDRLRMELERAESELRRLRGERAS